MSSAALVVRLEYVDMLAHDLGRALRRSEHASPATVGQLAGLLLRAAGEVYDQLQDTHAVLGGLAGIAEESLAALIRRGVAGS